MADPKGGGLSKLRHDLSNPLSAILAETQLLLLTPEKHDEETLAGRRCLLLAMSGLVVACGRPRPGPVTPAEIPALKAQAAQQPRNAQIQFRLAAALMAVGRCDTAVVVAKAGQMLAPGEALGAMVIG